MDTKEIDRELDRTLHGHANWAHRWDKENPTTYIYGDGTLVETVHAKVKILALLQAEVLKARINEIHLFSQACTDRLHGETWQNWSFRVTDYSKNRLGDLEAQSSKPDSSREGS